MRRIMWNGALLLAILFFPWWVVVLVGIVAISMQKKFYEIIGWAIFYDALYGSSRITVEGFRFFFTVGSLALLFIVEFLKSKTRFQ